MNRITLSTEQFSPSHEGHILDFHHIENIYSEGTAKSIPSILTVPYLVQEGAEVTQKT
jgi:hypothetical protein